MAVSNHRRTTRESQRLADQRGRCGDAKGLRPERGDEGRDLGAASAGAERSRDRAAARPSAGEREQPPGENGRHPAEGAAGARERCLSFEEREEISRAIARGHSARADRPGTSAAPTRRSPVRSTAAAGGGATAPTPQSARPGGASRRPRPTKLELCPELRRVVEERLGEDHSPEQIAGWLRVRYPDNEAMQVSHETIYRALYVQARGDAEARADPAPEARAGQGAMPARSRQRARARASSPGW